jgi:uncharacterized protein YoxC
LSPFIIAISITVVTVIIFSSYSIMPAYAHISKTFGNITIEVGWSNEPPLAGQINNVIIQVNKTSGSNSTLVRNALLEMDTLVKYGGVTKSIDFQPSEESEGIYEAQIIPTRIGSYDLILNGTIQGQSVLNAEIPLDDVESPQKISFPDSSESGTSAASPPDTQNANTGIGTQVEATLSQLADDTGTNKDNIDKLAKNYANLQKSVQDFKNSADRSYMIGVTAIGVGAAGILIASAALSRKKY